MLLYLRKIYYDIIKGCSEIKDDNNVIYLKHITNELLGKSSVIYEEKFSSCKKDGLKTAAQREQEEAESLSEINKRLKDLTIILDTSKTAKEKEILPSKKKAHQKDIDNYTNEQDSLIRQKNEIIGITAEKIANRAYNDFLLFSSFFKDDKLSHSYFNDAKFDDIDFESYYNLAILFNKECDHFNDHNLRLIACSSFFLNLFILCNDSVREFYNKSIVELTNYQADLFYLGKLYKNILSESESTIPHSIREDPQKLIDWFEFKNKGQKIIDEAKEDNVSLVGMTKEDMEILGIQPPKTHDKLKEALKQGGGSLNMMDFMKLQGSV